jgi:hypothetical protein
LTIGRNWLWRRISERKTHGCLTTSC